MITGQLDQFLTMKASGQKTDQVALVLTPAQLEDIRAALVQRRCRLTELLQLASETPAQPVLMAHLAADRNRISDLLLVVAKA